MFERFTDRARRIVVLAQEQARLLNHNYIGTEHILLGMLAEGEGVAWKTLTRLNVDQDKVRESIVTIIGVGAQPPSGHIPFTPRAKKVMELSLREGLQLGHNYIGTEHLLLGLIREGQGIAAQVLTGKPFDLDLNRVRQTTIAILSGIPDEVVTAADDVDVARRQVRDAEDALQIALAVATLRRLAPERLAPAAES